MKKIRSIEDNLNRIATALENGALDNISGGGSSEETWTAVFDGSVTTEYSETYSDNETSLQVSSAITADTIKVTFNGQEYSCPGTISAGNGTAYGGVSASGETDFSEYPFGILIAEGSTEAWLVTETAGTYSLKIEVPESSGGSGSSDFSIANVVIVSEVNGTCTALIPIVEEAEDAAGIYIQSSLTVRAIAGAGLESHIPIYKGFAEIKINYSEISNVGGVNIFGDIENVSETGTFYIRGDGQIKLLRQNT